jgi:hypothetical protein
MNVSSGEMPRGVKEAGSSKQVMAVELNMRTVTYTE